MKMNPIEGRITNFDRSSLVVMLLTNLVYIVLAPFLLLFSCFGKQAKFTSHLLSRFLGKYFARIIISSHRGMRFWRKVAIGKLPPQYIIIANHLSRLDLVYSASVFARPTYIGKVELKRSVLGLPAVLNGSIFVNREHKDSRKAALDALRAKAREGNALGLFPEGASNKTDGEPKEFKLGAFILAQEFNLPIVLAAVHDYPGTDGKREVGIEVFDILQPDQFISPDVMRDRAFAMISARLEEHRKIVEAKLLGSSAESAQNQGGLILQNSNSL